MGTPTPDTRDNVDMTARARVLGVALAAALPMGMLSAGVVTLAAPAARADEPIQSVEPIRPEQADVVGMIVLKESPWVSARSLEATADRAGADVAQSGPALGATISVVDFAEPLTPSEAEPIATALEARSDVVAVEPNVRVRPMRTPVIPNDPYFSQQWDMWDGAVSDFGTRAAQMWRVTRGAPEVVVGVVDTGSTVHPDLAGTTVPGFDFISDAAAARDGDRWDANPADEGDWCPEDNTRSDWHGTHVAGTINAIQDNGIGISGLAPDVKVQHLRALGECGGSSLDILSAVLWGAGGDLRTLFSSFPGANPGINPTPASVINLSLGGALECGSVSQGIFNDVRALGTTVVVAAGNESAPVSTSWPANCAGIVSVASSNRYGNLSGFSNYGTASGQMTITAPGGGIVSTANSGSTVPASPNYEYKNGTSMAAPHVAAAAAVLYSLGVTRPSDVIDALMAAVQPFPAGSTCNIVLCGAGLLDASKLVADAPDIDPGPPTNVRVTAGDGRAVVSWTPPQETGGAELVAAYAETSPGGFWCATTGTSCEMTGLTNGTVYTVAVAVTNAAGRTSEATQSASFTPSGVMKPSKVLNFSHGRFAGSSPKMRVTVKWEPPRNDGGSPIIGYRVRYGTGDTWKSWRTVDTTSLRLKGLRAGKEYRVQVRAINAAGGGARAAYSFRVPSA